MIDIGGLVAHFGLIAVFAGSFVEGETVVTLGGFAAHQRLIPLAGAAVAAFLGAFLADQLYFHLARRNAGHRFVRRLAESRVGRRAITWVARHPMLFALGFRFVPGMRTAGPIAIALAGQTPARFLALDGLASVIWAGAFTVLGFFASHWVEHLLGDLARIEHQLAAGAVLALPLLLAVLAIRHLILRHNRN